MPKENIPFIKRLLRSRLLIIAEIVVLVIFSSALAKEIVRNHQVEKEIGTLQDELADLEQNNIELQSLITYFDSDSYKEEQARLKLGLQKPGESVVAVLGDSTNDKEEIGTESASRNNNQTGEQSSNPQRWLSYFFKNNS